MGPILLSRSYAALPVEPPRIAGAGTRVGGAWSARIIALMCLIQDRDVLLPDHQNV
jgi:hypothetical protein